MQSLKECAGAVLALILMSTAVANGTNSYYVKNIGNDNANGLSDANAWATIAKVNSRTFAPGDRVYLKRGQTWREQLVVPSSGSEGLPITFTSYDSGALPIINGANLVLRWTSNVVANTWNATLTTMPNQVFFDGTRGTKVGSVAECNAAKTWYWAANVLYVYGTEDPSTTYTVPGVEASIRSLSLNVYGKSYVTVSGIEFTKGNDATSGTVLIHGSNYVILSGATASYGAGGGIAVWGSSDINITGSTVHGNLRAGVSGYHGTASASHENYVRSCGIYSNKYHGITFNDSYWIVQSNVVHDNGNLGEPCVGIETWDATDHVWARHIIIRYNTVYGTLSSNGDGAGIQLDDYTKYCDIYYNICYGNDGAGVSTNIASCSNIFNNVAFANNRNSSGGSGSKIEICLGGTAGDSLVVENNIGYSNSSGGYGIGVSATVAAGQGNVMSNNLWYAPFSTYWYIRSNTPGNSLATWNASARVGTDLNADPLFVSTNDFHLQPTSPCISAGRDIGLTTDYFGNAVPPGEAPDIGSSQFGGHILAPPPATTLGATSMTTTEAQLNGSVNPSGFPATYNFEYGTTTGYGSSTPSAIVGSGFNVLNVSATVGNLMPGIVYHFRIVATNSSGTTNGNDRTFTQGGLTSDQQQKGNPTDFSLGQNYPNPFNPSTTIQFSIPKAGHTTLKVYDSLGAEVVTLVSADLQAGRYSVKWNAARMASGVYFYRIFAGKFTETKRMVVQK